MELEQVYQQFARFAGLDAEAGRVWLPLCEAAVAKLRGMLASGAEENDARLVLAVAGEAYYQYALARGTDAQSVKIGEISVSSQSGTGAQSVRALRDELLAGASSLLEPADGLRQVL
ncbi:hypothetical protein [Marasmitruncus massiliensis]|uniref:hypothetical protein n=1 Tax=Marasmitruncus massiliensis TaxID=1944642 RepID=UPI000C7DB28B|nr:hypothetical protein [Marasmitruncus massiliensis]